MKIAQSAAIESYLINSCPKFSVLSPAQKAKDMQFCCIKEDVLAGVAKPLFGDKSVEEINKVVDKWFPFIQDMLPESGFVHGFNFPTAADCVVANLCTGYLPFGACFKIAEINVAEKYPKLFAHSQRVMAHPGMDQAKFADGNPFGM